MSVVTKTFVRRIPLEPQTDLDARIRDLCERQSSGSPGRRLSAAFAAHDQVVLIFQNAPDDSRPGLAP